MNNEKLHTYIEKAGSDISLSHEERERMRRMVHEYVQMKPIRAGAARSSAWFNVQWIFTPRAIAGALVVALFASSAGVSFAAQNALPGDILYPVKTQVNEPVQGALAVSASAKATWAINVANTRIQEAATLAAENKLSTSTQQQLQANFQAHAQVAAQQIAAVASSSPEAGAEAALGFQAQLAEYQQVLMQVAASKDTSVRVLADSVAAQQQNVAGIQASAEAQVAAADPQAKKDALAGMRAAATQQLAVSLGLSQTDSSALASSSTASVAVEIASASTTIAHGDQLADDDAAPQALGAFQHALSASAQLGAFLQASASIHQHTGLVIGDLGTTTASSSKPTERHVAAPMHLYKKGAQTSTTTLSVSSASSSAQGSATTSDSDAAGGQSTSTATTNTTSSASNSSSAHPVPQVLQLSVPTLP